MQRELLYGYHILINEDGDSCLKMQVLPQRQTLL
jgi:hypothetical protein